VNLPQIRLFTFLCLDPGAVGPLRAGKGNGDASVRSLADTPKDASFFRPPCVRLCVFVRCVRSHAAGAHEGTVVGAAWCDRKRMNRSGGSFRLLVRYRGCWRVSALRGSERDRIGDAFKSCEKLRRLVAAPHRW